MIASRGRGLRATTAWAQPMAVPFFSHAAAVIDSGPAEAVPLLHPSSTKPLYRGGLTSSRGVPDSR